MDNNVNYYLADMGIRENKKDYFFEISIKFSGDNLMVKDLVKDIVIQNNGVSISIILTKVDRLYGTVINNKYTQYSVVDQILLYKTFDEITCDQLVAVLLKIFSRFILSDYDKSVIIGRIKKWYSPQYMPDLNKDLKKIK